MRVSKRTSLSRLTAQAERGTETVAPGHFKDEILDKLADTANVAQFVSFGPGTAPRLRAFRIHDRRGSAPFPSVDSAIQDLLAHSTEHSVNVRSFEPSQPKAHDFLYGLTDVAKVAVEVRRLAASGLHTIVNETIDVNDGGVSGVSYARLLEFAPGDTPRSVEKAGTAAFPMQLGLAILETVYGFRPELDYDPDFRVEFSIHPLRRGVHSQHTIVWEMERVELVELNPEITWPNRFSRFLGDKAFGLLVADALGLPVPLSTVIPRKLAPFRFGRPTGSGEYWIRTCPVEQVPGLFTTKRGWLDPFNLMSGEDPTGTNISSVMAQEGVEAVYSGAALEGPNGELTVEGVAGTGEGFMQGRVAPERLPNGVIADVALTHEKASRLLGPVRFEWVHDGRTVWVVQLHRGASETTARVIYPGDVSSERRFNVEDGLEALRRLIDQVKDTPEGIVLIGRVGVTSHLGDILRRAHIPSRIEEPSAQ